MNVQAYPFVIRIFVRMSVSFYADELAYPKFNLKKTLVRPACGIKFFFKIILLKIGSYPHNFTHNEGKA